MDLAPPQGVDEGGGGRAGEMCAWRPEPEGSESETEGRVRACAVRRLDPVGLGSAAAGNAARVLLSPYLV
jgi:hypothetical protein